MKNALKVLAVLFFFNFMSSCTPSELNDEQPTVHASGDNNSGEVDNDRDLNGG